jgi:hypothetical protein
LDQIESVLKRITVEADISKKVQLAISFLQSNKTSPQDSLQILKQFEHTEDALQLVGNSLDLENDIQIFLLNYFIESKSDVQALPLKEYFIAKNVFVEDLSYDFNNDVLVVDGKYNLSFQFEHEVPEEMKDLPHFNREPMFGEFVISIDKNKKITVEDISIGEEIDGQVFMGSFKL